MVSLEVFFHTSKLMRFNTAMINGKTIRYVSISLNRALKRINMQNALLSSIIL